MRIFCNVGESVRIKELQKRTGWLSVRQSVMYHSLMDARRVITTQQPAYLYHKLCGALEAAYRT